MGQTGGLIRTPRAVVEQEMAEHLVEGPTVGSGTATRARLWPRLEGDVD